MHKKEYVGFGLKETPPDVTPSENVLVSVWIPETTLRDWDRLPERERHEIARQTTYFISLQVAKAKRETAEPKEEWVTFGD